jgi:hypothetical protein
MLQIRIRRGCASLPFAKTSDVSALSFILFESEWIPESGLGPGSGGLGAVAASGPQLDVQGSDSQGLICK